MHILCTEKEGCVKEREHISLSTHASKRTTYTYDVRVSCHGLSLDLCNSAVPSLPCRRPRHLVALDSLPLASVFSFSFSPLFLLSWCPRSSSTAFYCLLHLRHFSHCSPPLVAFQLDSLVSLRCETIVLPCVATSPSSSLFLSRQIRRKKGNQGQSFLVFAVLFRYKTAWVF
jgi:hypothetical protein